MAFFYKLSIDTFQPGSITGWCFQRFNPGSPLKLVFYSGEKILGSCTADQLREDLQELGMHPDGRCGFTFILPEEYHHNLYDEVKICVAGKISPLAKLYKKDMGRVPSGRKTLRVRARQLLSFSTRANRPVVFMHIPKTAGTSFNSFARNHYHQDEILTHIQFFRRSEFNSISRNYTFVAGHLGIGEILQYFPSDTFSLYSLIREPYAHLHSHLNWLRGIGSDRQSDFYHGHHKLFRQLADEYGDKDNLSHEDLQTLIDNISGVLLQLVDNCQTRHFLNSPPAKIDISCRQEMKENLSLFTQVGLTEEYDRFLVDFCKAQALTAPRHTPKPLNRSRLTPLFDYMDPVVQEIIRPLVETDLLLYDLARKRFNSS